MKSINFTDFPSPAVPEISKANIYAATFHSDLWMLRAVALEYAKGHREVLSDLDIKRNFIKVHFAQGDKLRKQQLISLD